MLGSLFNRSFIAVLSGYAIEKYDMFLYGFFAITIGELFFPHGNIPANSFSSIIFGLGIFAAGYIMRPIGGVVLGHLGDRFGRKKALLVSIGLSVLPPLIVGFLPTYKQAGIISPILLTICRIFQGFCSGGEFSGAAVFLQEHTTENKRAFSICVLRSVGFLGVALGTIIAYLSSLPSMPAWGWRVPFLVGAFLTFILYFVRRKHMMESPYIEQKIKRGEVVNFPLIEIFKKSKSRLVCAMSLNVYASMSFYISTIYASTLLKTELHVLNHQVLAMDTAIILIWMVAVPFLGLWAVRLAY